MNVSMHPMEMIKNELFTILNTVPQGSEIYYLDYPVYSNIGDLLILKGTEQFFKDNNIHVRASFSGLNFPEKLNIPKDVILVMQGGGNFGDLYVSFQNLREKVIQRYSENRIVILPQTVHFKSKVNQEKSRQIFSQHKDLHLYARDTQSLNEMKGFSNNIYLSPDMAHQLWPLHVLTSPNQNTLFLLRNDKENNLKMNVKPKSTEKVLDWKNILSSKDNQLITKFANDHRDPLKKYDSEYMYKSWSQFKDRLIEKTISYFSLYEEIVTSRLHGHILACLMNKKNTLYDNSYGKNRTYYHTWTFRLHSAKFKPF